MNADPGCEPVPSGAGRGRPAMTLSEKIWSLAYRFEEARQRYAASGRLVQQAAVCIVLAVLRIVGVQHG